jgi:hypothetical protein
MLVESGRHVIGRALALLLQGAGGLLRIGGHALRYLVAAVTHLYDIYIIIPLQAERLVRRGGGEGPHELGSATVRNPAERTAPFRAPR